MELSRLTENHNLDAQPATDTLNVDVQYSTAIGNDLQTSSNPPQRHQHEQGRLDGIRRFIEIGKEFTKHTNALICSESINVLLIFVPIGIAIGFANVDSLVVFIFNALAIIPLAVLISIATERLASRLGDTVGALLNVTVGNAAELM